MVLNPYRTIFIITLYYLYNHVFLCILIYHNTFHPLSATLFISLSSSPNQIQGPLQSSNVILFVPSFSLGKIMPYIFTLFWLRHSPCFSKSSLLKPIFIGTRRCFKWVRHHNFFFSFANFLHQNPWSPIHSYLFKWLCKSKFKTWVIEIILLNFSIHKYYFFS